ncbi:MAG: ParD-like family protein [Akkermansiaceae bacterium]|nr:ParD-like family protein [Akkermansiaceae bacterium]MCF7732503.1 ParD-like family protein [Akkermansiaceae bacterium]
MSASIRLNDELIAAAKRQAKLFHRSPPQQIEHWAAIGRVMESALSYPAQEKVAEWGSARDIDSLRASVESDAGRERAKQVIRQTAGTIVSNDRNPVSKRTLRGD